MNRTDAPKKQPVIFGTNGQRENLPDTTPAGDNTASYDVGFPAVTMILKSAGGLPPKGQDMNQILFELSAIGRWLSAGALNSYDATFATAIGGYPKAAVLVGDDGATIFISTAEANTANPNTTATGWLNLSKITAIAALAGGADKLPYFTGVSTASQTDFTSVGRDIVGKNSIADVTGYLGLNTPRSMAITSSQTVTTLPSWVTDIWVSGCAGGGGGASGATNNGGQSSLVGGGGGGGGGAGQSVLKKKYTITAGQPLVVTIGSGGNGATGSTAGGGSNGKSGGTTSITGLFTLSGGTGGYAGGAVLSNTAGNGGAGGYGGEGYPAGGSGGDGNYAGGGGSGASTPYGGGGGGARAVKSNPTDSHLLGQPADGYGSGGGGSGGGYGSASAVNSYAGGNGAPGILIIEW